MIFANFPPAYKEFEFTRTYAFKAIKKLLKIIYAVNFNEISFFK